jgi:MFS transporter, DHA1 family, tetracycline resistance protein
MKKTPLTIIFLIVFIDLLGFGIVIPILPMYAEKGFGASDITVGFLVASFSIMQLIFTPIWGRISDKVGRKPILLLGLASTIASYIIFGIAATLPMLFLSRILGGIGGANISAAQAYIADVTTPRERAKGMGLIGAAFGLGFVFGPVMGGLLVPYGYALPGITAATLSFIAFVTAIVFLPESHHHVRPEERVKQEFSLKEFIIVITVPKLLLLLLLFFLLTFAYANIYATFPLLAEKEFGYNDRQVGYLFGFLGVVGALTQGGLIRVLIKRYSERHLFLFGSACTMIGLTLIPFSHTTWMLLLVLTVLSLGAGTTTPTSLGLISTSADAEEQGGVLGFNQALGALARALGPVWGGLVFQKLGHIWPFLTGGFVMLFVFLLAYRYLRTAPIGSPMEGKMLS